MIFKQCIYAGVCINKNNNKLYSFMCGISSRFFFEKLWIFWIFKDKQFRISYFPSFRSFSISFQSVHFSVVHFMTVCVIFFVFMLVEYVSVGNGYFCYVLSYFVQLKNGIRIGWHRNYTYGIHVCACVCVFSVVIKYSCVWMLANRCLVSKNAKGMYISVSRNKDCILTRK